MVPLLVFMQGVEEFLREDIQEFLQIGGALASKLAFKASVRQVEIVDDAQISLHGQGDRRLEAKI